MVWSTVIEAIRTDLFMEALFLLIFVVRCFALTSSEGQGGGTERPVIGVLSMELSPTIQKFYGRHDSYIAASYVKFIEGAGGRVAPILIGQDYEYYRQMVGKVNGLLLPGGATYIDDKDGYGDAGRQLYRAALEMNNKGVHYPVMGICLGMELLVNTAADENLLTNCTSEHPLPLKFLPGSLRSRLFMDAPPSVIRTLQREDVTVNHHRKCITRENLNRSRAAPHWRTLTVNDDRDGVEFISAIEHRDLPFYGVMFHPEKNIYEWKRSKNYPHSERAIKAARFFADFLLSEARRNNLPEREESTEEETQKLISQHQAVYTGKHLMWEHLYFFSTSPAAARPQQVTVNVLPCS